MLLDIVRAWRALVLCIAWLTCGQLSSRKHLLQRFQRSALWSIYDISHKPPGLLGQFKPAEIEKTTIFDTKRNLRKGRDTEYSFL